MRYPDLYDKKDNVAERIELLFKLDDFELSIEYLRAIHRYLFRDILPDSGNFRKDNLTKKEDILNGKSVIYPDFHTILTYLEYDLLEERKIDYSKLTIEDKIRKVASFTSRIWQTHPFDEGNTRTTCVFIEKYLKYLGFTIDNSLFKKYADYFRNALVKANYYDYELSIRPDIEPLVNFLKKVLIDPSIELNEKELYVDKLFEVKPKKREKNKLPK